MMPSSSSRSRTQAAAARIVVKGGPGLGVEVDTQLVGVAGIVDSVGPQVEAQAPQVHRPQHMGDVGDDQGVGRGPVRGGHHGGLQPVRRAGRDPLLEEGLAGRPLGEALEHGRPAEGGDPEGVGDGHVVGGEIELGGPQLREVDLVRIGDRRRSDRTTSTARTSLAGTRPRYRAARPASRALGERPPPRGREPRGRRRCDPLPARMGVQGAVPAALLVVPAPGYLCGYVHLKLR